MEELALADWRRRMAEMYARWRADSARDPRAATERLRATRDELFRDHPQSPLSEPGRAGFGGLAYFPYDPAYRFLASFDPAAQAPHDQRPLALPASVAAEFEFRLIGHVTLGGPLTGAVLPVFWMEGYAGGLFLPFRDATSGHETYGAGRYLLDTVKGADQGGDWRRSELLLDFNLAYHPSCAYDPRWNCPLASPESRLGQPVRVGERLA